MDTFSIAKIQNVLSEMSNQIAKDNIDSYVSKTLMSLAINRISLLLTHIGYIESKVESLTKDNQNLSILLDNLKAENQRLAQLAKY